MKITWLAHASFLIEAAGIRLITDPYRPGQMSYPPVTESADIVVRSSADDDGHCFAEMIPGDPTVVTTTELPGDQLTIEGITFDAIPVQESLIHKDSPIDNAMVCFTLEGIRVGHMGDVGNPLTDGQLAALAGVDVLLALTGGPPTLELDDLDAVIRFVRPRIVIPMHFQLLAEPVTMLPVTAFTERFPREHVEWMGEASVMLDADRLPPPTRVVVLDSLVLGPPPKSVSAPPSLPPPSWHNV